MEVCFPQWTQKDSVNLEIENATWSLWIPNGTETTGKDGDHCTEWSYGSWLLRGNRVVAT